MEKLKKVLWKFSKRMEKETEEISYDHIVTIENNDGRTEVSEALQLKCRKKGKIEKLLDITYFILMLLLWITSLIFFVKSAYHHDKLRTDDDFYCSYLIIIFLFSVTGIYFESYIIHKFEIFRPKIVVLVRRNPEKYKIVLRVRVVNASSPDDFIETVIDDNQLNYESLLEVCATELKLDKNEIDKMRKFPQTKIRGDDDVKRFRRLEYVEVLLKKQQEN